MKKILLYTLLTLFIFRIVMVFCGLHFYSVYAEEFFWFILSLIGVGIWFIKLGATGKAILVLSSLIVYSLLYIVVGYFTWLIIGTIDSVQPQKFKNLDKVVWMQFHQGSWGGRPYETIGIGKSYFGGLLYTRDDEFEYDPQVPNLNSDKYEIPREVTEPQSYIFWEKRGWLFDFEKRICYKLKKRKSITLSNQEIKWKRLMEQKLKASIFFGKGTSDIDAIYENPTVIYLTIRFKKSTTIQSMSNKNVENLSAEIVRSLTTELNNLENYDQAYLHFVTNDHRETLFLDSPFDYYTLDYKYARFDLKKGVIIPNKPKIDYVKSLWLPWTNVLTLEFDTYNKKPRSLCSNLLGVELHNIRDHFPAKVSRTILFKGLECKVYEGEMPNKLKLKNGYLINGFRYLIYGETVVDLTLSYKCYPSNSKFRYKDVVNELTGLDIEPDYPMCYRFVNQKNLKFKYETDEVIIKSEADTSKFPWTITYNTSITKPIFVFPYKTL